MAPFPISPQANFFSIESIIITPNYKSISNYFYVKILLYIYVFIAGATKTFFLKSQALKIQVNKLSHKPFEILAKVFADKGDINKISAQFLLNYFVP
jgi:hypothetical protein